MRLGDHWIEADCIWYEQRVIVELDSRAAHHDVHSFERRPRPRPGASGSRLDRHPAQWRQLHDEPEAVARDLYSLPASAERRS